MRVLIAGDKEERVVAAARAAERLFGNGHRFTVLDVAPSHSTVFLGDATVAEAERAEEAELATTLRRASTELHTEGVEQLVARGNPAWEIARVASDGFDALVVCGPRPGPVSRLLGRSFVDILLSSGCPVVVVPPEEPTP